MPTEHRTAASDYAMYEPSRANLLSPAELRALMEIRPWRVARDLALTWLLLVGLIQVGILGNSWVLIPVCLVLIGCLQNGLITWTHEASHGSIHRNRKVNDTLSDLLICGPAGICVDQYRWHHVNHHKYLGNPDKEVELAAWLCLRGGSLFTEILRHLGGGFALQTTSPRF